MALALRERYDHIRCKNKRCKAIMAFVPLALLGRMLWLNGTYSDEETPIICGRCMAKHRWYPATDTQPMRLELTLAPDQPK